MSEARTPEEIRESIVKRRTQLVTAVEELQQEAERLADWRSQLRKHRRKLAVAAFAGGFLVAGGFKAFSSSR